MAGEAGASGAALPSWSLVTSEGGIARVSSMLELKVIGYDLKHTNAGKPI
jgi:hypothetical protein